MSDTWPWESEVLRHQQSQEGTRTDARWWAKDPTGETPKHVRRWESALKPRPGLELFSVHLVCEPPVAQPISFCKEKYDHLSWQPTRMAHLQWRSTCWSAQITTGILLPVKWVGVRVAQLPSTPDWGGCCLDWYLPPNQNSHLSASSQPMPSGWTPSKPRQHSEIILGFGDQGVWANRIREVQAYHSL